MTSEFDFIKQIREQAAAQIDPDIILGIGDDAAIVRQQSGQELLLTVDLLVEEIDFRLEYAVPRWLGHKALAVSLSDIAAMGGVPKGALLTLGIPPSLIPDSKVFWKEFFEGYFALAGRHGVSLIGGDISATPDRLIIDSFVIGHCLVAKAVRRSGARTGDAIYLTGTVGASAAGLKWLLEGTRVSLTDASPEQSAIRSHLRPEPRVKFGAAVGETGLATAMIDVSDGLTQDLEHLCEESGVAAIVDFDAVPIAEQTIRIAGNLEQAFAMAVSGGEDFELLLTANPENGNHLAALANDCGIRLTRIGEIVSAAANAPLVALRRETEVRPLLADGYDHFAV